jgi:iron complex outermembrane receptor protein
LLWNHLVIDGAYHQTHSDGYIDGTSGHSGSYYGGAMYINNDENLIVRYKLFGNFEKTGQAWNGVTAGNDDYSMNAYDGITSYKDMYNAGLGRFNSLYERFEPDWNGNWQINRYVMSDGTLWNKATDNFWQSHHLFSLAWQINDYWSTSASVHYTHGYGYYNEFRYQNKLKKFGLANYVDTDGKTVKKSDFIRKKGLSQDAYGMVWNVNYKDNSWNVVSGIAIQNFEGNHFGYLTYANPSMASIIAGQPINYGERWSAQKGELKYYDSDAEKSDASAYVKGTYSITDNFDVFGDLQFRHVRYITNGINDKFYANADGTYSNQHLDINKKYDFFNPKAGLSFHKDGHSAYVSYAISHREPERNNFTDNGNYPAPLAERLNDLELGYMYTAPTFQAGLNAYYMNYRNQFVQTGQKSDIGEALTTNIKDSYRLGVEITAGWSPLSWLSIEGNAALSRNHIKQFDEVVETYDDDWNDLAPTVVHYDKSTLAFSPSAILNGFIDFHYKNFQAMWHTNYVSRQYLDNTENRIRSLPSFSTSNVNLSYTLNSEQIQGSGFKFFKEAVISMNLNNIFNRHYAANGWVYSAIVGNTYPEANRYYQIGYMPMAGFNMMGSVTLRF